MDRAMEYNEFLLATLTAASTNGQAPAVDTIPNEKRIRLVESGARFYADVTAISGTSPSVTFFVEAAFEDGTFVLIDTFTAITAVGQATRELTRVPRNVRIRWTITGTTPSVTAKVRCSRL